MDINYHNLIKGIVPKEFKDIAKGLNNRISAEYDNVVAITGGEGGGKSNAAALLAPLIYPKFSFKDNCAFIPDEKTILKEYHNLPKGGVYWLDEAIRAMYKLNWNTKLQQILIKMFSTERWRGITTLLCIPRFTDLSENLRNHRVHYWVHMHDRTTAFIYKRDDDRVTQDSWHLERDRKRRDAKFKGVPVIRRSFSDVEEIEKQSACYVATVRNVPPAPPEYWNEYLRLKELSRPDPSKIIADNINDRHNLSHLNKKYYDVVHRIVKATKIGKGSGISIENGAKIFGVSKYVISNMVKDEIVSRKPPIPPKYTIKISTNKKNNDTFIGV